jgi:hypothetical protein
MPAVVPLPDGEASPSLRKEILGTKAQAVGVTARAALSW